MRPFARRKQILARSLFRDEALDFQARGVLGRAAHGASEVGEVLTTLGRISGHKSWVREWSLTARRVEVRAEIARQAGHRVSASTAYLQAATYWAAALDGLCTGKDSARLLATFRSHRACWEGVIACSDRAFERISIPYGQTVLPGYLLRPDTSGRARPTLIMTNGSDGAISDLWSSGAAGALARGWNAFVYDGPGQQHMLFEQKTRFRPDWEAVLTPVVDTLCARTDVDAQRLMAYGVSQAGYWLPRALAFEHRIVAAVVDPGVVDVSSAWTTNLNADMRAMLDEGRRAKFNRYLGYASLLPSFRRVLTARSRPYEHADWFELFNEVRTYRLTAELARQIQTPLMITNPEDEQFWPGQSQKLADLLAGRAHLVPFAAAEGANLHCQPLARLLTEARMFDWLSERLSHTRRRGATRRDAPHLGIVPG